MELIVSSAHYDYRNGDLIQTRSHVVAEKDLLTFPNPKGVMVAYEDFLEGPDKTVGLRLVAGAIGEIAWIGLDPVRRTGCLC
jgi:hypothetical protein